MSADAKHTIRPGTPCLTIQEPGTPFKRSYCAQCFAHAEAVCQRTASHTRCPLSKGIPVQTNQTPDKPRALGETLVEKNRAIAKRQMIVKEEIMLTHDDQPTSSNNTTLEQTPERLRKVANFRQ